MPRRAWTILALLATLPLVAEPPPAVQSELARTEQTLQTLAEMKEQVAGLQARIEELIRELSERKGALANAKPAPFGGVLSGAAPLADHPDPKPRVLRCAALTRDGDRCTRAAVSGARYCRQHALGRSK